MTSTDLFHKAVLSLDRDKMIEGERTLREALAAARTERDFYNEAEILCCLGEVLRDLRRDVDARAVLQELLSSSHLQEMDTAKDRARRLLAGL